MERPRDAQARLGAGAPKNRESRPASTGAAVEKPHAGIPTNIAKARRHQDQGHRCSPVLLSNSRPFQFWRDGEAAVSSHRKSASFVATAALILTEHHLTCWDRWPTASAGRLPRRLAPSRSPAAPPAEQCPTPVPGAEVDACITPTVTFSPGESRRSSSTAAFCLGCILSDGAPPSCSC